MQYVLQKFPPGVPCCSCNWAYCFQSAPNEGSVITSDDGRGSRFDDDGSSITAEDAESANIEEHGESERPQSNTNSKADGEGLEDGGRNEPSSRQGREPSEEGEIDDLEEGELKSDSDFEVPLLKAPSRSPKEVMNHRCTSKH